MPIYCYTTAEPPFWTEEIFMHAVKDVSPPTQITLDDGRVAFRNIQAEWGGGRRVDRKSQWPIISSSAGVHPDQVAEAEAYSREIGIPTRFTKDGDVIFESRDHRKRYCEAVGLFDRDSYGSRLDPSRRSDSHERDYDGPGIAERSDPRRRIVR